MIVPHFKQAEFDIEVKNGKYPLSFQPKADKYLILNYMAVYPKGDARSRAVLEQLEDTRRNNFNAYWKRLPDPVVANQIPWKVKEALEVWGRKNSLAYVYANTSPDPLDTKNKLILFGTPGERVSGALMIRGGKKLKNMKATLAGLPGEIFFNKRSHMVHNGFHLTWIAPNHLVPAGKRDLDGKTAYAYRYRYRIPANAKPGTLRGKVRFQWQGGSKEVPVSVTVLPIRLPELSDHLIALDTNDIRGTKKGLKKAMEFCRDEAGCTTAHLRVGLTSLVRYKKDAKGHPVGGERLGWFVTDKELSEWLRFYKEMKFINPMPVMMLAPLGYREALTAGPYKPFTGDYVKALHLAFDRFVEICRKEGVQDYVLDTGGEMGHRYMKPHPKAVSDALKVYKILRNKPGTKLMYRCNCATTVKAFFPYLDVMGIRGEDSWEAADRITNYGKKKFLYTYSIESRFMNGLHSWAHGGKGNVREWLYFREGIENNNFLCNGMCGRIQHCEAIQGENESIYPTIRSEAFYASTIDRKYLRLLENAIAKAPASPLRSQAEKFLEELRQRALEWVAPASFDMQRLTDNPLRVTDGGAMRLTAAGFAISLNTGKRTVINKFPKFKGAARRSVIPAKPEPDLKKIPAEAGKDFDDSAWAGIQVGKIWESQGYDYDGLAWYSVSFEASNDLVKKASIIQFDAVDETAWVYLNGHYLGTHDFWNRVFKLPLKGLKKGKNRLAVLVRDMQAVGGIWKPVSLRDKAGKKVLSLDKGWKFYPDPATRAIAEFRLDTGLIQFAGKAGLSGMIRVVPAAANTPDTVHGDLTLHHNGRKIRFSRKDLLKPMIRFSFPPAELKPGTEKIRLYSNGKKVRELDCYVIDRAKANSR